MSTPDQVELSRFHSKTSNLDPRTALGDISSHPDQQPNMESGVQAQNVPLASEVKLKLLSCCLSFFFAGTNDGSVGALLPYMLKFYGVSTGLVVVIYVAAFVGWLVAGGTNFFLASRLSLGLNLVLGAFLQLLAHALRVWAPPFPLFAVTFFLAGLGTAYQDSHSNTFVSRVTGAHRWLGVIHAMYGAGLLVSPFVATPIASSYIPSRWYHFYYFPLAVGVVNLLLVLIAFRDRLPLSSIEDERQTASSEQSGTRSTLSAFGEAKATLKLKSVWLLSMFYFFYLGAALTSGGWVVEYLVTVRHGNLTAMGFVPAGMSAGVFLGRLALAEPTHRFGERRMVLVYVLVAIGLQLVYWLVPNIIVNAVAVCLMSFTLSTLFPTGMSVGSKLFPKERQSSALGLVFVVGQAGGALFPSLTGLLATRVGVQVLQPVSLGLLTLTGASWALVPKVKHRSE